MSRASFNATATVRFGPGTATPGVVKAIIACRWVRQDRLFFRPGAFFSCNSYINTAYNNLSAGTFTRVGAILTIDISKADTIEIIALGLPATPVRLLQLMTPFGGVAYYRATIGV